MQKYKLSAVTRTPDGSQSCHQDETQSRSKVEERDGADWWMSSYRL